MTYFWLKKVVHKVQSVAICGFQKMTAKSKEMLKSVDKHSKKTFSFGRNVKVPVWPFLEL